MPQEDRTNTWKWWCKNSTKHDGTNEDSGSAVKWDDGTNSQCPVYNSECDDHEHERWRKREFQWNDWKIHRNWSNASQTWRLQQQSICEESKYWRISPDARRPEEDTRGSSRIPRGHMTPRGHYGARSKRVTDSYNSRSRNVDRWSSNQMPSKADHTPSCSSPTLMKETSTSDQRIDREIKRGDERFDSHLPWMRKRGTSRKDGSTSSSAWMNYTKYNSKRPPSTEQRNMCRFNVK